MVMYRVFCWLVLLVFRVLSQPFFVICHQLDLVWQMFLIPFTVAYLILLSLTLLYIVVMIAICVSVLLHGPQISVCLLTWFLCFCATSLVHTFNRQVLIIANYSIRKIYVMLPSVFLGLVVRLLLNLNIIHEGHIQWLYYFKVFLPTVMGDALLMI
jgi:hypothetical protein